MEINESESLALIHNNNELKKIPEIFDVNLILFNLLGMIMGYIGNLNDRLSCGENLELKKNERNKAKNLKNKRERSNIINH